MSVGGTFRAPSGRTLASVDEQDHRHVPARCIWVEALHFEEIVEYIVERLIAFVSDLRVDVGLSTT